MKVVFSDRAFSAIMAETTEKIETETGGLFLGTVENGIWYVIEAIDPGPKSVFEVAYFEYDQTYTQHLINKVANIYEAKLDLIGLWHRHPGSFDVFSSTDNGTNSKYAKMRGEGAISALVNVDPRFRLTMYHVAPPCKYTKIAYVVGNDFIPEKYLRLKTADHFEKIMKRILSPSKKQEELHPSASMNSFFQRIMPYLVDRLIKEQAVRPPLYSEEINNNLIDRVVPDITFMSDVLGIEMSVLQKDGLLALVQDTIDGVCKAFFAYDDMNKQVIFQFEGNNYIYEEGLLENLYRIATEVQRKGDESEDEKSGSDATDPSKIVNGVLKLIGFYKKGE